MGRTVLVSSHILGEIERITEQIVLLHRGQCLPSGTCTASVSNSTASHTASTSTVEAKRLAKSIIDMEDVHGVMIPSSGVVDVLTHDLGAVHQNLPALSSRADSR